MSNKGKGALAGFLLVVAVFAFKNMLLNLAGFQSDPKSAAMLQTVADKIKQEQGLPVMIDEQTQWFDMEGQKGMLVYDYRLVKVSANEFDAQAFLSRMKPVATERACESSKGSLLLKQGIVMRYSYVDKSDTSLASFDVNPGDCDGGTANAPAHHEVWKKYEPQPEAQAGGQPETPWRDSATAATPSPTTTKRAQQNVETPEMKAQALVDDGNQQLEQKNYDAAIKDFKAALALDPNNYAARSGLQEAQRMR